MKKIFYIFLLLFAYAFNQKCLALAIDKPPVKKILIVVQGSSSLKNFAIGDGRQLATLMGHFSTSTIVKGVQDYKLGELNNFDYTFYVGFEIHNDVPATFLLDVYNTNKPVIWLSTGMVEFCQRFDMKKKFGFTVSGIDSVTKFDQVTANGTVFTKGEPRLGMIHISNPYLSKVIARAYSTTKQKESPYAVSAKNLIYFADSPFAYAIPGDHYNYFADLLHDILKEGSSALASCDDSYRGCDIV